LILLHELRDDAIQSFLTEHGIAKASASEEVHKVAGSRARARPSDEYVRTSFSSTATDKGHSPLSIANIHHDLPKYFGEGIRLMLKRLRLVGVT
jgi:hypothetical protein